MYLPPLLIHISLVIFGVVLIYAIKLIYSKMVSSTAPAGKQIEAYVEKAKELKAEGLSYQKRLKYFRKQGLLK